MAVRFDQQKTGKSDYRSRIAPLLALATTLLQEMATFFATYPLVALALGAILGSYVVLKPSYWVFALPLITFWFWKSSRCALFSLLFFTYWSYQHDPLTKPSKIENALVWLTIDNIREELLHGKPRFVYQGIAKIAMADDKWLKTNYTMIMPTKNHPSGSTEYLMRSTCLLKSQGGYRLIANKGTPWYSIAGTHSYAEDRLQWKRRIKNKLKPFYQNGSDFSILIALLTGELADQSEKLPFAQLSLQHILAISGFHFALLAQAISVLFGLFLSKRSALCLTFILLTLYFLFLGVSPSIERAWIVCAFVFLGKIFYRKGSSLNALGAAACIEIFANPAVIFQYGFLLSFTTTLSLLLLYPPLIDILYHLIPKRSARTILTMNYIEQIGIVLLIHIRASLAANIAAMSSAFPLTLLLFQRCSLLGIIYNLFIPIALGISMLLAILGLFVGLACTTLSARIHTINSYWLNKTLLVLENAPPALNYTVRAASVSAVLVGLWILSLWVVGIIYNNRAQMKDLSI